MEGKKKFIIKWSEMRYYSLDWKAKSKLEAKKEFKYQWYHDDGTLNQLAIVEDAGLMRVEVEKIK